MARGRKSYSFTLAPHIADLFDQYLYDTGLTVTDAVDAILRLEMERWSIEQEREAQAQAQAQAESAAPPPPPAPGLWLALGSLPVDAVVDLSLHGSGAHWVIRGTERNGEIRLRAGETIITQAPHVTARVVSLPPTAESEALP